MVTTAAPSELPDRPVPGALEVGLGLILGVGAAALSLVAISLTGRAFGAGSVQQTIWPTVAMTALDWTLLVVGGILRLRRPDNAMGWVFLVLGFVGATTMIAWAVMAAEAMPGGNRELGHVVAWIGAVYTLPAWTYLLTTLVVRFPEGVPATPGEHRLLRWAGGAAVVVGLAAALRPGPLLVYPAYENPIELPDELQGLASVIGAVGVAMAIVPMVLAVGGMVRKYRASAAVERLQLRWFAFAAAITLTTGILYVVIGILVAPTQAMLREMTFAVFVASACGLPVAVLVAISRYHLYDIDELIGRTVAYGALTAILAGLYAASVRLFNALFVAFTGEESEAALVLTTLVLATTFTPIKGRLERLAARRFRPEPREPVAAASDEAPIMPSASVARDGDLDARIEAIARRVAREVVEEGSTRRDR